MRTTTPVQIHGQRLQTWQILSKLEVELLGTCHGPKVVTSLRKWIPVPSLSGLANAVVPRLLRMDTTVPTSLLRRVSGLDPSKQYVFTYSHTPVPGIFGTFLCSYTIQVGGIDIRRLTLHAANFQYTEHTIIFQPNAAETYLGLWWTCTETSDSDAPLGIAVDDISLELYNCPCAAVENAPAGQCGLSGYPANQYLGPGDTSSIEACALSCATDSRCKSFGHLDGANAQCTLFDLWANELDTYPVPPGYNYQVFDSSCFRCPTRTL